MDVSSSAERTASEVFAGHDHITTPRPSSAHTVTTPTRRTRANSTAVVAEPALCEQLGLRRGELVVGQQPCGLEVAELLQLTDDVARSGSRRRRRRCSSSLLRGCLLRV